MRRTRTLAIGALLLLCATAWSEQDFIVMIPMRDGVHLRARVRVPDGPGSWPVLLTRTPNEDADLTWNLFGDYYKTGFALVNQSTRGRFGSEGADDPLFLNDGWGERQDGYDTTAWILQQPWCNGKIGAFGGSARGALVNMLAGAGAPGLSAEFVWMSMADLYRGTLYYGGAWELNESTRWYAPYGVNTLQRVLEHPTYDTFWRGFDISTRQHLRDHPVLLGAGWYDTYFKNSIDNWRSLREHGGPMAREHSKLVLLLWAHKNAGEWAGMPWPAAAGAVPEPYGYKHFFDHYMLGVDNGYDRLPRVCYYMMGDFEDAGAAGNEFRYVEDWPPPSWTAPLYLHADHVLRQQLPAPGAAPMAYAYDPANPVPTIGGATHYLINGVGPGSFDQQSLEGRSDVLVFTTEPLASPVEIAGPVSVTLWASSDCADTDFTAKLTDVYPDGRSIILRDGIVRAPFRDSLESPTPLVPGRIYEFTIDLWHAAIAFNTGHRIRVAISSSNYPRFEANPNTGEAPAESHAVTRVAHNTLYLDKAHPSRIHLPLIGPDSDGDGAPDYGDAFPVRADEQWDVDGDGMGDVFEQRIVDAQPDDPVADIDQVLPASDFDGDGKSNLEEFLARTDPADHSSYLPAAGSMALCALAMLLLCHGWRRASRLPGT